VNQGRYFLPLEYPPALRALKPLPRFLNVVGDLTPGTCHVAIVGARAANPDTIALAKRLAEIVVAAGGVVISGGADGADAAAHAGAIDAKGRTWAVLGCGAPNVSPAERPERFEAILASGGALIRPFAENVGPNGSCYKGRNRILVALADLVIIAQAGAKSGTKNAANHAHQLGKEVWVAPGVGDAFSYSWELIDRGARMLRHESELAERLRRPKLDDQPQRVYDALIGGPKHPDEIAGETGLSTSAVATALLTLALGDVVVEGSAGLFQRK
jgi:DNA processing protein